MVRTGWLVLLALAACGTEQSNANHRPYDLAYITETILAPSCGAAQCHSTFKQSDGVVFDTVAVARRTLVDQDLIHLDSPEPEDPYAPADPAKAALVRWVTETFPFDGEIGRMPYDAPLPKADVDLFKRWIAHGAPGAQCDPELNAGLACKNPLVDSKHAADPTITDPKLELAKCTADFNFGDTIHKCAAPNEVGCSQGHCLCASSYGDCNSDVTDGCESKLDTDDHCGGCFNSKASDLSDPSLSHMCMGDKHCGGTTTFSCLCPPNTGDCDSPHTTGAKFDNVCETPLNTNTDCGACRAACTGATTCQASGGIFKCL